MDENDNSPKFKGYNSDFGLKKYLFSFTKSLNLELLRIKRKPYNSQFILHKSITLKYYHCNLSSTQIACRSGCN